MPNARLNHSVPAWFQCSFCFLPNLCCRIPTRVIHLYLASQLIHTYIEILPLCSCICSRNTLNIGVKGLSLVKRRHRGERGAVLTCSLSHELLAAERGWMAPILSYPHFILPLLQIFPEYFYSLYCHLKRIVYASQNKLLTYKTEIQEWPFKFIRNLTWHSIFGEIVNYSKATDVKRQMIFKYYIHTSSILSKFTVHKCAFVFWFLGVGNHQGPLGYLWHRFWAMQNYQLKS